jgi:hypothetical protein
LLKYLGVQLRGLSFFLLTFFELGKKQKNRHCTTTIGGIVPVPPLVMEMQTGSTNNHISQIFFVFPAPVYLWDRLAAPAQMVHYKGDCQVDV